MAEKHIVVQGAVCMCNFGATPDKLKVLTQHKEYINDTNGSQKLIASTLDIGPTFEKNTFGPCAKLRKKPCTAIVLQWKGFYEDITLSNGGQILLEDSKASCPIGGSDCIKIVFHGQTAEISVQNFKNVDIETNNLLNPAVNIEDITTPKRNHKGLETT